MAANRSGGLSSNRAHFADRAQLASPKAEALGDLLFDPQTSGGLLVAVGAGEADAAAARFAAAGVPAVRIGRATSRSAMALVVR